MSFLVERHFNIFIFKKKKNHQVEFLYHEKQSRNFTVTTHNEYESIDLK